MGSLALAPRWRPTVADKPRWLGWPLLASLLFWIFVIWLLVK